MDLAGVLGGSNQVSYFLGQGIQQVEPGGKVKITGGHAHGIPGGGGFFREATLRINARRLPEPRDRRGIPAGLFRGSPDAFAGLERGHDSGTLAGGQVLCHRSGRLNRRAPA